MRKHSTISSPSRPPPSLTLTPPVCNGCPASNDLRMPSQGSPRASVCRVEGRGGGEAGEGADCVRPRWLLFAWLCRRIQTRANIDVHKHARIHTRVYSRAITSPRAHSTRTGRFNIPIVYSSGSVNAGLHRRKITSILVNTPPLHARNNERQRGGGSCDATFPSFPPRTDGIFCPRKKAASFEYLVIQPRLSSPSHLIPPCKFVAEWNARVLRLLFRENTLKELHSALFRDFFAPITRYFPRDVIFFSETSRVILKRTMRSINVVN